MNPSEPTGQPDISDDELFAALFAASVRVLITEVTGRQFEDEEE